MIKSIGFYNVALCVPPDFAAFFQSGVFGRQTLSPFVFVKSALTSSKTAKGRQTRVISCFKFYHKNVTRCRPLPLEGLCGTLLGSIVGARGLIYGCPCYH